MASPEMWMPLPALPEITLVRIRLLPPVEVMSMPSRALPTAVSTKAGKPQKVLKTTVPLAVSAISTPFLPLPALMFPSGMTPPN